MVVLLFLYITLHYDWVSFLFKLLKAVSVCRNTVELIRHTKRPEKCVGLYRMSEYSGFILINRTTLGPYNFV